MGVWVISTIAELNPVNPVNLSKKTSRKTSPRRQRRRPSCLSCKSCPKQNILSPSGQMLHCVQHDSAGGIRHCGCFQIENDGGLGYQHHSGAQSCKSCSSCPKKHPVKQAQGGNAADHPVYPVNPVQNKTSCPLPARCFTAFSMTAPG